ncbi:LysE family translocator [Bordetella genomosp. 9]|uniref:Amino acid transporter n=1 Tax=Bordetella genomosp. 9 TaxID=1416803 RepID=A0A1W6YWB2_9BORD|nr:LysE family transporter [Bordetella genomosp. 9]ARP85402.1 amino acid transporter [Bordetella genomosp. 9]ARP89381.1 amino acid transporter [Bordetella genomosp. 9]
MLDGIHLPLILGAALIAAGSPGPATLAIASTSMTSGRRFGLALASGITSGSVVWSVAAAFGLSAAMLANVWIFETLRYVGAAYLLYLGAKSIRSALRPKGIAIAQARYVSWRQAYVKGLVLHLTNPKAILFFGSLYAVGVPAHTPPESLAVIVLAIAAQSLLLFHGYALLFSSAAMTRGYLRLRRPLEALFAAAFVAAGVKVLLSRAP